MEHPWDRRDVRALLRALTVVHGAEVEILVGVEAIGPSGDVVVATPNLDYVDRVVRSHRRHSPLGRPVPAPTGRQPSGRAAVLLDNLAQITEALEADGEPVPEELTSAQLLRRHPRGPSLRPASPGPSTPARDIRVASTS